jgi:hypothetical protein
MGYGYVKEGLWIKKSPVAKEGVSYGGSKE